jgi:beta-RFAP synthase
MIRVRAPSRLHFGLLNPHEEPETMWPNALGEDVLPARHFGSVGLMVETPGAQLSATPAEAWSADGPLAQRTLAFARRFAATLPPEALAPQHFQIEQCPPEHAGLGTGTQLGLVVAQLLAHSAGANLDVVELARRVGRGQRSALGIHGFAQGGFLVEGGKVAAQDLAPLLVRVPFPETWRLVLALPGAETGLHGARESQAFQLLASTPSHRERVGHLCRLVLLGMLPALAEHDWRTFSEALYDFNVRVGEMFRPVQGGTYAHPRIADLVTFLRRQGVPGVGQSSWGPTVFAVAPDADRAEVLALKVREYGGLTPDKVLCTRGCNQGAQLHSIG